MATLDHPDVVWVRGIGTGDGTSVALGPATTVMFDEPSVPIGPGYALGRLERPLRAASEQAEACQWSRP